MYMLFWNLRCDNYSRETTIQGRKLLISKTFLVRQVFKGDNYSKEETIRGNTVCIPCTLWLYVVALVMK